MKNEQMEMEEDDEYEGPVPSLQSLRKAMEEMGFTSDTIEMVLKMDQSRDLSRLVQLATLIQEDSELTESQIASMSEWEQAVSILIGNNTIKLMIYKNMKSSHFHSIWLIVWVMHRNVLFFILL